MLQEVFDACQTLWESTHLFGWPPTASDCKDLLLISVNSAEKCFKRIEKAEPDICLEIHLRIYFLVERS